MNYIIIGGTSYIAHKICCRLLQKHSVYVTYRNKKKFQSLYKEYLDNNNLHSYRLDLKDIRNAVKGFINSIPFQKIDCFINFAVYEKSRNFLNISQDDFNQSTEINLTSNFILIKYLLSYFNYGGHIIVILSVSGLTGNKGQILYNIGKSAMAGFVKSVSKEIFVKGIKINAICPGLYSSPLVDNLKSKYRDRLVKSRISENFSDINDLYDFIDWLIQTEDVTGQIFNIDSRILYHNY